MGVGAATGAGADVAALGRTLGAGTGATAAVGVTAAGVASGEFTLAAGVAAERALAQLARLGASSFAVDCAPALGGDASAARGGSWLAGAERTVGTGGAAALEAEAETVR